LNYTGKDNLDIMNLAKNYNNYIFNWINENKYEKILDFGAGTGEYCSRVSSKKITAIEIDDSMRNNLECNSYKSIDDINNDKFDLIYSLNVLEHIEDHYNIVKQLIDLLSDDGEIKILVPARMELYSKMDEKVGHYRRYNKNELVQLFSDLNIDILECKYFDFLGYFASFVYKYLDNSGEIDPKSLKIYDKFIFPLSVFIDKITLGKIIGKNLMLIARKKNG
jgi:SAM-dependent methyltransferase